MVMNQKPNYQELINDFIDHDIRGKLIEEKILKRVYEIINEIHGHYPLGLVNSEMMNEHDITLYEKTYNGYIRVTFDYPLIQPQYFEIPLELIRNQNAVNELINRKTALK